MPEKRREQGAVEMYRDVERGDTEWHLIRPGSTLHSGCEVQTFVPSDVGERSGEHAERLREALERIRDGRLMGFASAAECAELALQALPQQPDIQIDPNLSKDLDESVSVDQHEEGKVWEIAACPKCGRHKATPFTCKGDGSNRHAQTEADVFYVTRLHPLPNQEPQPKEGDADGSVANSAAQPPPDVAAPPAHKAGPRDREGVDSESPDQEPQGSGLSAGGEQ